MSQRARSRPDGSRRMSPEKSLMAKMGVWTCKDVRQHLQTTEMTEEEQIHFIEQNMQSSKGLQSYIQKQHYNVKDLKFMEAAGRDLTNVIGNKAYELYSMLFDASDLSDDDCVYLKEKMKTFYSAKEAAKDSKWAKVLNISKQVLSKTYEYGKWAAEKSMEGITYGLSWAVSKGFQLWTWISSNPKTAYFTLLTLKSFKNTLCRMGGQYLGSMGVLLDDRESVLKYILKVYPDMDPPPPDTKFQQLLSIAKDASGPAMIELAGKSASKLLGGLFNNGGKILKVGLSGAVKGIPLVGPMLSGAVEAITDAVCAEAAEQAAFMVEQTTYQAHVNNCFSMLKDLINPFECMQQMAKEAYAIVKPPPDDKALVAEAKKAAKIGQDEFVAEMKNVQKSAKPSSPTATPNKSAKSSSPKALSPKRTRTGWLYGGARRRPKTRR